MLCRFRVLFAKQYLHVCALNIVGDSYSCTCVDTFQKERHGEKGTGQDIQEALRLQISASNYGKYHYKVKDKVKGLLDSIPAIRYEDGNFIVREEDFPLIRKFLEDSRSSYRTWRVIARDEEAEKLKLHSV